MNNPTRFILFVSTGNLFIWSTIEDINSHISHWFGSDVRCVFDKGENYVAEVKDLITKDVKCIVIFSMHAFINREIKELASDQCQIISWSLPIFYGKIFSCNVGWIKHCYISCIDNFLQCIESFMHKEMGNAEELPQRLYEKSKCNSIENPQVE